MSLRRIATGKNGDRAHFVRGVLRELAPIGNSPASSNPPRRPGPRRRPRKPPF